MLRSNRRTAAAVAFAVTAVLLMVVIFLLSNDPGEASDQKSDPIVGSVLQTLGRLFSLSQAQLVAIAHTVLVIVRKSMHACEFAALGFFIYGAVYLFGAEGKAALFCSWLGAALYGVSDEIHQIFVPDRSGEFADMALDALGAALGVFVFLLGVRLLSRRRARQ